MKPTYGHYIDGAEVVGGHEILEVRSPFDQSLVTTVAAAKAADVDVAVAAAAAAFADGRWSGLQPRQRARVLLKTAQLLTDEIGWLAEAESRQTGRCVREMRAQLARLPEWLEHFAALAQGMEGQVPPFSDAKHLNYVRRVPLGVCALITPWNHPLLIALKKIAPVREENSRASEKRVHTQSHTLGPHLSVGARAHTTHTHHTHTHTHTHTNTHTHTHTHTRLLFESPIAPRTVESDRQTRQVPGKALARTYARRRSPRATRWW